jgi:hypothetical protein
VRRAEGYDEVFPDLSALILYLEQRIDLCRDKLDVEPPFDQSVKKQTLFVILQESTDFKLVVQHFSAGCKKSVEATRTTL